MWLYMSRGFFSVVAHRDFSNVLIVRARVRGDIEAVFGEGLLVSETPQFDYRYRAYMSRGDVARAVAREVEGIGYPDFKGSVECPARHAVYFRTWEVAHALHGIDEPLPVGEVAELVTDMSPAEIRLVFSAGAAAEDEFELAFPAGPWGGA